MAKSFWSKRKDSMQTAGGYIKATDSVSRPMALLMTVVGILIVGGLLFGVFATTRWAVGKITNDDTSTISSTDNGSNNNGSSTPNSGGTGTNTAQVAPGPSITATTSTSTTTPSAPTPTPVATPPATTASAIPRTGSSNYISVFMAIALLGYLAYRKKQLQD